MCGDSGCLRRAGLDGFGGILFADENLQEAEFGLDPLVLPVLLQHRHPVLLLNISTTEEGDRGEKVFILLACPEEVPALSSK